MPQAADLAPDWSQPSTPELCCPLCEYNLRGLCRLIFVQSMRRARIRKRHVLRVIVYGCDFSLLMLLLLVAGKDARWSSGWPLLVALGCAALTLYRAYFAYSRYLRFDRPFLTVLSSQIMVFLVAFIVYLQMYQPW